MPYDKGDLFSINDLAAPLPIPIKALIVGRQTHGRDARFRRAFKFLAAKGYVATGLPPELTYREKLYMSDLIWAAENVEPRLFQIIPTAAIRFSHHFDHQEFWPEEVIEIIRKIKSVENKRSRLQIQNSKIQFRAVPLITLLSWINFEVKDRRVKRVASKLTNLRIDQKTFEALAELAAHRQASKTDIIHEAIEFFYKQVFDKSDI